ncbi:MAG: fumarylacetoacetate hydrolase family protein [Proteobacteria bacterium]|nr:fumarylacetoacetate hydrolase family protein [Pseudomonadota bacterium]
MRFATVEHKGKTFVGLVDKAGESVTALKGVAEMNDLFRTPGKVDASGETVALSAVKLKAPIPLPLRNIMCVGKNYIEHAKEFTASGFDSSAAGAADAVPTAPIIFTKVPQSVIGPGEAILYPTGVSEQLDYEAELAVIVGKGGRGISKAASMDHVWGYTILNDVTARDIQGKHKQWFLGKSMDTFAPMGPFCATADEVDLETGGIKCWVNGELRQDAKFADLIFDVPTLIETISAGITLMPGDIIATGTPVGVGIGFKPPKFLKKGDKVEMEVAGIGRLANHVA